MTEAKRAHGMETGKRFYDLFTRWDRDRPSETYSELQGLGDLAVKGGITHEEALLLLAPPDEIESMLCKKDHSATGMLHNQAEASIQRLLAWSDTRRRLKVLVRADSKEKAHEGMLRGAQGIGLIRGEEILREDGLLQVYQDWLQCREDEERRVHYRRRIVSLWTESWASIFQAAGARPCAVSLVWDALADSRPEERLELQDIQLESLFRAVARCQEEEIYSQLELLALWPMDEEEFLAAYDLIEEVGRQTLGSHRWDGSLKIGALLHPDVAPSDAAGIARSADLIVMDTESASRFHLLEQGHPLGGPSRLIPLDEPVSEWASPALLHSHLEETVRVIRMIKPNMILRAGGDIRSSDLRTVYRLEILGVCCAPEDVAAVKLTGLRLEMSDDRFTSAEEA
ncbi:PEP-utilizing enzyme, TIM barrel domain protein [Paenibacillus lemnae]|uniref:PEP-utilizing enzyme, TIM barrel domain protein n=1 Tax=Paenibacillus lemnae TaxID=1330551 RepID=A0A848MB11_PAELE|nr:PEP-utilizing enzyme, TIM barrel domain protein [Paenibacillus lemnae]NMO97252.1 PEP-utilizing enzyme, TIM barrel domain protein [Paenibacillus lemnae]